MSIDLVSHYFTFYCGLFICILTGKKEMEITTTAFQFWNFDFSRCNISDSKQSKNQMSCLFSTELQTYSLHPSTLPGLPKWNL